jgi:23S rRNA maturation mini-RNase III
MKEIDSRLTAKINHDITNRGDEIAQGFSNAAEQDRRKTVDPEVAKMATGVKDLVKFSQGKGRRRKTRRGRKSRKRTVRKYY